jgi:hypothetical protein
VRGFVGWVEGWDVAELLMCWREVMLPVCFVELGSRWVKKALWCRFVGFGMLVMDEEAIGRFRGDRRRVSGTLVMMV